MPENPLNIFQDVDPEFFKLINSGRQLALGEGGALPQKFKYLIAMALDAAAGAEGGVGSLARQAMAAGATKAEIVEALRVAQYISGIGSTYTAAYGLKDLF